MSVMSQRDVLRKMEDGYYLIQPVSYDDKEPPFYLVKNEMDLSNYAARHGLGRHTEDKELVPRSVVRRMIESGKVKLEKKTSNWKTYK